MIFVTLGSQKFQFDRLLEKVDELIDSGLICDEVFAQTGCSTYRPKHYGYKDFLDRDEFARYETRADLVITHGGTGSIIGAVKQGKKVIAVPRLAKYGEHVDDHQIQLIRQFGEMGIIEACYDVERLGEAYMEAMKKSYRKYESNTDRIIASIDDFLKGV